MENEKLNKWADLLLDTGKRNNLINFRDTKAGTAEVVLPEFSTIFDRAEQGATFEVYDPKLYGDDDDITYGESSGDESEDSSDGVDGVELIGDGTNSLNGGAVSGVDGGESGGVESGTDSTSASSESGKSKRMSRQDYIDAYGGKLKKHGQILIYNSFNNPITALKNIGKKAKTALEETGVNIAYMAFGFINWTENDNSRFIMRAPILLVPITIVNDSAIEPYYIKVADDEIILNPTFLYKLQNEYGIKLPEYDDEGVETYLNTIEGMLSKLKWTVTRECKVGIFSFLKINMYKDLKDNAQKISSHSGVKALLGDSNIIVQPDFTVVGEEELHNVVDADSSQTEAIEMARSGQSFVLQGPPGTGKSQTITNIIAECLANGKKVLFVSEKLAALNVVYDKLKKAGLEEFCLELHSHKANKREVIAELCNTLKKPKSSVSGRAKGELEAMINARRELDQYAEELHKINDGINKSIYSLYEEVAACRNTPICEYEIFDITSKGEKYIEDAQIVLRRFVEYIPSIGYDYRINEWYGYRNPDSSYQGTAKTKSDLTKALQLIQDLNGISDELYIKYALGITSLNNAYALREFFNLVGTSKFITPKLLDKTTLSAVKESVAKMGVLAEEILEKKKIIDEKFDEDVYKLDGRDIFKKLSKKYSGFISRLFSKEYKEIISNLKMCRHDGKKPKYKVALFYADALRAYQQKTAEFLAEEEKTKYALGKAYVGVNCDFTLLNAQLDKLYNIINLGVKFGNLPNLSQEQFELEAGEFIKFYERLNDCLTKYSVEEGRLFNNFDKAECDIRCMPIEKLYAKLSKCLENIDKLPNWCEFIKLLNRAQELELRDFIDKAIDENLLPEHIISAYNKNFYTQWIDALLQQSPILLRLTRIPHDEAVKMFKAKDELNFEINRVKIKAKLSAERPSLDMVAQGSAISKLLREGEKKRKQKGIRALLEEISDLVLTLKPCFLMSPLSVSTFLSPDIKFDVVVFDEASQIFPQDAIGAIYRGKQLIVVGDSKQMPPSNFFNAVTDPQDDDEETEDITDFESILDLCSTSFPQKRLKWHYRSRYEQLISFSNKNFYDNELVTFPSATKDKKGIGVDYYYVDGVFDRKSKTNRIEAEYIVNLVFENIEKYPQRSLGVVAFSISQQNLIDKLITKRRQSDPSKEEFFKSDRPEPFFVKNLETVQGDERDTIIFSIAYAKDSTGKLLMNFGPLNREGGERRLNVAVTRAKINVQLVTSMHYTDIDISRTKSEGGRLLREYLDYAQNGVVALDRSLNVSRFERFDSDFEMEVCEFLKANGYSVDTQVGCSSFRIDLAVKRPETSDYVLAIECDGATYHSSKSARDRDRLRQEILERMGWKFYRIWSTDWFRNNRVEKERLLSAVKDALDNAPMVATSQEEEKSQSFEEVAEEKHFAFPTYEMADEIKIAKAQRNNLPNTILEILKVEAPLSEEWLIKRIAFMFGREKVTTVVREGYTRAMLGCSKMGVVKRGGFLYLKDKPIPMLRVPKDGAKVIRDIKYISLEELSSGILEILKQNVSVEKSGLFRLIAKQLGFTRIGDAICERLQSALNTISDKIIVNGEVISLK